MIMKHVSFFVLMLSFFFILPHCAHSQSPEDLQVDKVAPGNIWTQNCKSCHTSKKDLDTLTTNITDDDVFKFIYEGDEKHVFKDKLSDEEIMFLVRFLRVWEKLHVLEKRFEHLPNNINL